LPKTTASFVELRPRLIQYLRD